MPSRGAKFLYGVCHSGVPRGANCIVARLVVSVTARASFPVFSVGGGLTSHLSPRVTVRFRDTFQVSSAKAEKLRNTGYCGTYAVTVPLGATPLITCCSFEKVVMSW